MFKRKGRQLSFLDDAEMFGGIKLNHKNIWVQLAKQILWCEFDDKYAKHFTSGYGKLMCSARLAFGALLILYK